MTSTCKLEAVFCCAQELWRGEVILVSWKPRAFLFKDFLTEEECEYMISKVCSLNLPALI